MDAGSGPPDAIESLSACPGCGSVNFAGPGSRVRVVDISQVEAGWIAHGVIYLSYQCMVCGAVYTQIVQSIPIECASFPCPRCGPGSKLTPEVMAISEAEGGYSFIALLKCDSCSRQSRLSKLLAGLSKITRVKVGPTGIEVEVKP
jgi:hypothetical protein